MSVVNKMLNDLENRDQSSVASADYQPPEKSTSRRLVWIFLLVLFIAAAVWAYLQYGAAQDPESSATANRQEATAPNTVSSIDPSVISDLEKLAQSEDGNVETGELESTPEPAMAEKVDESVDPIDTQTMKDKELATVMTDEEKAAKEAMLDSSETSEIAAVMTEKASNVESATLSVMDKQSSDNVVDSEPAANDSEEPRTAMAVKPSDGNEGDSLKLSAQKALTDKDSGRAIELLGKILNEQPTNVNARKQLASLLFANQEFGKAESMLKRGLELNSQQHDVRLMLARLYQRNNRSSDALSLLQQVTPEITLNTDYYGQRASLAQRLSEFEQAGQDYQILAKVEPEQAKWWLGVGVSADRLNNTEMAILGYTRALSLDQLDPPVIAFMQQRLRGLGR